MMRQVRIGFKSDKALKIFRDGPQRHAQVHSLRRLCAEEALR
jgi:hypothetical protein